MRRTERPTRRGAALLLVLAVLVMVVALAAPAAEVADLVVRDRRDAAMSLLLEDLLGELEAPIGQWLAATSARVVLGPDSSSPAVEVLDEVLVIEGHPAVRVRVSAFDQCGMVPWVLVGVDRALTLSLPNELQRLVLPPGSPGLDVLVDSGAGRVFPRETLERHAPGAVGELIASHNPRPGGWDSRPALNVNTAPPALLAGAMRSAGRGGLEAIRRSRSDGRPFTSFRDLGGRDSGSDALRLVSSSGAWAFRIDLRAPTLARSWWAVYVMHGSEWRRVQRLAITE